MRHPRSRAHQRQARALATILLLVAGLIGFPTPAHAAGTQLLGFEISGHQFVWGQTVRVTARTEIPVNHVKFTYNSSSGGARTPQWSPNSWETSSGFQFTLTVNDAGRVYTLASIELTNSTGTRSIFHRDGTVTYSSGETGPTTHSLDFAAADWTVDPYQPAVPSGVTAAPGDGRSYLSWPAPADRGSPITAYEIYVFASGTATDTPHAVLDGTARSLVVEPLTNGTSYRFAVNAINAEGSSGFGYSNWVIPTEGYGPPGPPETVTAQARVSAATVRWQSPLTVNGNPITKYTVTSSPDAKTCTATPPALACTIADLTNGQPYTFTVTATNAAGVSAPSSPSNTVTPTIDTIEPNIYTPLLSTDRVRNTGTFTVEVRVTDNISGVRDGDPCGYLRHTTTSKIVVFGCFTRHSGNDTDGIYRRTVTVPAGTPPGAYRWEMYAYDKSGNTTNFRSSQPPTVVIGNTTPPQNLTAAVGADRTVTLTWEKPQDDGGNVITGYQITDSLGGTRTVEDLTWTGHFLEVDAATPVIFTIRALNAGGASAPASTEPITIPAVIPGVPGDARAVNDNGNIQVSWTPPTSTGGAPIDGYTVTASPGGQQLQVGSLARQATFNNLPLGVIYTFTIAATNAAGTSGFATTGEVTPVRRVETLTYPEVTGTHQVGRTLRLSTGTYSPAPDTIAIVWSANGVPIASQTGTSLPLTPALVGKRISVSVRAHREQTGYQDAVYGIGFGTTVAKGTLTVATQPAIRGTLRVGATLRAAVGAMKPTARATYSWYVLAGGQWVRKKTNAPLPLTSYYRGKWVQLRVTYTAAGYNTTTLRKTSAARIS